MNYTVYVLRDKFGKLYKGVTNSIDRRLREHLSGKIQSTRKLVDPVVIYQENFSSFEEARKREVYLKTAAGRRFLKKMLGS